MWHTWQEFLSMGGRGEFVWSAYGAVALALLLEVLALRAHLARARRAAAARARRPG